MKAMFALFAALGVAAPKGDAKARVGIFRQNVNVHESAKLFYMKGRTASGFTPNKDQYRVSDTWAEMTLTHAAGNAIYTGAINGTLGLSGGYMYFNSGVPASGFTVNGALSAGYVYMRQSGTFTGADITAQIL